MYTNFHYMFGGNNSYVDYYFGNNYILQKENELLKNELKKEKEKNIDLKATNKIIQDYIINLENKNESLNNVLDDLKFKYNMLKENNDVIEDFEKI